MNNFCNNRHSLKDCKSNASQQMYLQTQPSVGVFRKRCSENIHQIYRRALIPSCDFNKVALTVFSKKSALDVWLGSGYASDIY